MKVKAYTLLEFAIVLVVIGVIIMMVYGSYSLLLDTKKDIEGKARVDMAVSKVINWASTRGRLPKGDEFPKVEENNEKLVYSAKDILTDLVFNQPNPICGVTEEMLHKGGSTDNVSFSVEFGKYSRNVTLNELKSGIECRDIGENLAGAGIATISLPIAYLNTGYVANIEPFNKNKIYKWCIEPNATGTQRAKIMGILRNYSVNSIFSNDCSNISSWFSANVAQIRFLNLGSLGDLQIGTIPLIIHITDSDINKEVVRPLNLYVSDIAHLP